MTPGMRRQLDRIAGRLEPVGGLAVLTAPANLPNDQVDDIKAAAIGQRVAALRRATEGNQIDRQTAKSVASPPDADA